ncbi:MAG: response regulator [Bacteroidales bacterium]
MVVEDISAMRVMIRQMLRNVGIQQVVEAADGSAALQALREQPVDLILSDWNMIPMTGLQLLRAVREEPRHRHTPFIMVTGQQTAEHVIRARAAGVSGYLVKPFGASALALQLSRVLRCGRGAA